MSQTPETPRPDAHRTETTRTDNPRIACMGASDVAGTALGHPRVWLQIDPVIGHVECGYCDRRFLLAGSVADVATNADH